MPNGDDDKKLGKFTKIILGEDPTGKDAPAYSRLTRTPVTFEDQGQIRRNMADSMKRFNAMGIKAYIEGEDKNPYKGPAEGSYKPEGIQVTSYRDYPSYSDVAGVVSHEDIHALLEKAGYKYPDITKPQSFWQSMAGYSPQSLAERAMQEGMRAGNPRVEVPAYVGAYNPKQLPGFSEEDRQRYLTGLYQNMTPQLAVQLKRIIAAYEAGQKFIK